MSLRLPYNLLFDKSIDSKYPNCRIEDGIVPVSSLAAKLSIERFEFIGISGIVPVSLFPDAVNFCSDGKSKIQLGIVP